MSDKGWSTTSWSRKSEKQYVVPEGGLKAALCQVDYARAHSGVEEGIIKRALQDFVRWLYDELDSLEHKPYDDVLAHEYNACLADVRRMFLAPEEDYADRILKNASPGYTPTHAELDKIWDHIFRAGHGWTPPEMRHQSSDPEPESPALRKERLKTISHIESLLASDIRLHGDHRGGIEPEIPEAVKDLGCTPEQVATLDGVNKEIAIRANNAIAEAYRRGQKEGSRA